MNLYMKTAIKEAKKSLKYDDVPVGAVIVYNNQIVAMAHNAKEKSQIATHHAEILAINKACKKLKTWYLSECILYVTMEPCLMCCGAILQSRIKKIVYGIPNDKFGCIESIATVLNNPKNNHKVIVENDIYADECKKLVQDFFKEKRK